MRVPRNGLTRRSLLKTVAALTLARHGIPARAQAPLPPKPEVIFVPTPQAIVEEMLKLARVGPNDVLYDLGCGDGRLAITAVTKFGAKRAVGIDIDPIRIAESKDNAIIGNVTDRVTFRNEDLFKADISEATVVTLYLLRSLNIKLLPKLMADLKPGTRIVSHNFDMGDEWEPEKRVELDHRSIYLWTIPEKWSLIRHGSKK